MTKTEFQAFAKQLPSEKMFAFILNRQELSLAEFADQVEQFDKTAATKARKMADAAEDLQAYFRTKTEGK